MRLGDDAMLHVQVKARDVNLSRRQPLCFLEIIAVALVLKIRVGNDDRLAIVEVDAHLLHAGQTDEANLVIDAFLSGQSQIFPGQIEAVAAIRLNQIVPEFVVLRQIAKVRQDGIHFLADGAFGKFDDVLLFRLEQVQVVLGFGAMVEDKGNGDQRGEHQSQHQRVQGDPAPVDLHHAMDGGSLGKPGIEQLHVGSPSFAEGLPFCERPISSSKSRRTSGFTGLTRCWSKPACSERDRASS